MRYVNTSQRFNPCLGAEAIPEPLEEQGRWKLIAVNSFKVDQQENGFSWLIYTWELQALEA